MIHLFFATFCITVFVFFFFFFSSRRRHTRSLCDWSSECALPIWPFNARTARRSPPARGGPEGKLRGRPPPPQLSRSGPWRRTGSESITGRARTRLLEVLTNAQGPFQLSRNAYEDLFQPRFLRAGSAFAAAGEPRPSTP